MDRDTVGLIDLVNGRVVAIGDTLTVSDRVKERDTVGLTVLVNGRVVAIGDILTVTERVRERDAVGVMDLVKGLLVRIGDGVTVTERVSVRDTEGVALHDVCCVVTMAERVGVKEVERVGTVALGVKVASCVIDLLDVTESVGVIAGVELGRFVCVVRLDTVRVTTPLWLRVKLRLEETVGV